MATATPQPSAQHQPHAGQPTPQQQQQQQEQQQQGAPGAPLFRDFASI